MLSQGVAPPLTVPHLKSERLLGGHHQDKGSLVTNISAARVEAAFEAGLYVT